MPFTAVALFYTVAGPLCYILGLDRDTHRAAVKMAKPDSKKIFFENLSGAGKAIAVLTSGGDAQGKLCGDRRDGRVSACGFPGPHRAMPRRQRDAGHRSLSSLPRGGATRGGDWL